MSLRLITAPTFEPVTVAEAKAHCRVEVATDDAMISTLIAVARERCEHELDRSLMRQTWERVLDGFDGDVELGKGPILVVESVSYVDAAGVTQTLAGTAWSFTATPEPGYVVPAYGYDWPATLNVAEAVRVRFRTGYTDSAVEATQQAAVPKAIKQWILLQVGVMYENREDIITGTITAQLPGRFADGLLDRYRLMRV